MGRKKISGTTISMNQEINMKGPGVRAWSKKRNTWPRLTTPTPDISRSFAAMLPSLMGALPVSAGTLGAEASLAMAALGAVCTSSNISLSLNSAGSGFLATYTSVLQRMMSGASVQSGTLDEEKLKKQIMDLIRFMLEQAGPAFENWKQLLMDVMQNGTLKDFMKGVQSAICAITGDPVNANTGNFLYDKEDLSVPGRIPLQFKRFYNRIDSRTGCMGRGWRHNYEIQLLIQEDRYVIIWEDGREEIYIREEGQPPEALFGCFSRLIEREDGFCYQTQEGETYLFDANGHLTKRQDKNGQGLLFLYDGNGRLSQVSNGSGSFLSYQYEKRTGQLLQVVDHSKRAVTIIYELGLLKTVTNPSGQSYTYYYDKDNSIYRIRNPRDVFVLRNKYDDQGRTVRQEFADGGVIQYDYQEDLSQTFMTEQNGNHIAYVRDERYRNVKTVYIDGEETFAYNDRNQMTLRIDKNGNKTRFAYDAKGNIAQVIYPDGSKHNMTYDANNRLLVVSVNGKEVIKNTYDTKGNLLSSEDALNRKQEFIYDDAGKVITVIQADKSSIFLEYDQRGNIIQMADAQGNKTVYTYDELNRVTKTTDGNGYATRYAYDANHQIVKVVNAEGKSRSYGYTKNGKLSQVIDFNGAVTNQTYNDMNEVSSVITPDGGTWKLEYDLKQNVTKRMEPTGAQFLYEYDELSRLERTTLPTGGIISYTYDANGNRTGIIDANGNRTSVEYDEMNRVTAVTEPDGARIEYEYDMDGRLASVTDAEGKTYHYTYDAAGQLTVKTDMSGNAVTYEYNELGKVSRITNPKGQTISYEYEKGGILGRTRYPDGGWEQYSYDKNGNLIRKENHKGDYQELIYDCLNRIVLVKNSFGQEQQYTYDAAGNVTAAADPNGNTTKYEYSPGGNLIAVIDAAGNKTEYAYDANARLSTIFRHKGKETLLGSDGNLLSVSSPFLSGPLRLTRYERDAMGKITRVIDPLGQEEFYKYDPMGQLTEKTDKEGYQTSYSYTPFKKLSNITYHDGRSVMFSYNALRQLVLVQDWLGTTAIESDKAGRVQKVTDHAGREVCYQWSQTGEREAIIYPDGRKVSYQYDDFGHLSHMEDGTTAIDYRYNEDGRLAAKEYANRMQTLYSYNSAGGLESLTHQFEGAILEQYQYSYDKSGNKIEIRKERSRSLAAGGLPEAIRRSLREASGTYQYQYDSMNRLIGVEKNHKTLHRYEYDAFGNRVHMFDGEQNTHQYYQYNAMDQLLKNERESYQYDHRGNLTGILKDGKIITGYQYDETNRLSRAFNGNGQMASYDYNGFGNRTGKREYDLNTRVYNPDVWNTMESQNPTREIDYLLDITKEYHNLLAKTEITSQGKTTQKFTWDSNLVSMTAGENAGIYLLDELGSPVRLLGIYRNYQTVYGYDEFGQDVFGNQGEVQPFGYTGYQLDGVAGTYFAQAREYLQNIGRFGGEDIIKGDTYEAGLLNVYGYCNGNPINWVDMDGKKRTKAGYSTDNVIEYIWQEYMDSANKAWKKGWESIWKWGDDTFDVTIEFGTGLGAKGTIHGVVVGAVVKNYIEIDDHYASTFKSEAEVLVGKEDLLELVMGVGYDYIKEEGKARMGINSVEWDGTLKTKYGGEIYAGIGGGGYISVDWIKIGDTIYKFGKALIGCDATK